MKYVDLECRYTRLARATSLSLLSSLWRWRAEGLPSTLAFHSTAPEVLYSPYSLPPTSLRPPNRLLAYMVRQLVAPAPRSRVWREEEEPQTSTRSLEMTQLRAWPGVVAVNWVVTTWLSVGPTFALSKLGLDSCPAGQPGVGQPERGDI